MNKFQVHRSIYYAPKPRRLSIDWRLRAALVLFAAVIVGCGVALWAGVGR